MAMLNGNPIACRGRDNCVITHAMRIKGSLCRHGTKTLFVVNAASADLKNNRLQDRLEFERFGSLITDELV